MMMISSEKPFEPSGIFVVMMPIALMVTMPSKRRARARRRTRRGRRR